MPLHLLRRRRYSLYHPKSCLYTSSAAAASAATYPKSSPYTSAAAAVSAATYLIPCSYTSAASAAT